jgi:hypothetical protein
MKRIMVAGRFVVRGGGGHQVKTAEMKAAADNKNLSDSSTNCHLHYPLLIHCQQRNC